MSAGTQDPVSVLVQHSMAMQARGLLHIEEERQRIALRTTAEFIDEHMPRARSIGEDLSPFDAKMKVLDLALDLTPTTGLFLEFGVYKGDTLRKITARRKPAHGFDSFEGLPEDWRAGYGEGAFATKPPVVKGATLHVGWFSDTLPKFFAEHEGPIALAHIDADLYSSTVTIFTEGEDRFVEGSVLLFDEYFNYPGWKQHEHKAFMEFIERTGHGFEYVAYNAVHQQVLVRLTS